MSPTLISQDGRWWWDGTRWRSRVIEGPLDLFWFTTTPEWLPRILLIGLIALIPIVGSINALGWILAAVDMQRQHWKELPPGGFGYLSRGVAPFFVQFLYGLVVLLVLTVLIGTGLVLVFANPPHYVIGAAFFLLAILLLIAWWLISLYFFGSVLMASDRLGFERVIDPRVLIRVASVNREASLHVALTYGVATLVVVIVSGVAGAVIPFGGIAVALVVPAVYCLVVPRLATFKVDG